MSKNAVVVMGNAAATQLNVFKVVKTTIEHVPAMQCSFCDFIVVGVGKPASGTLWDRFPDHECPGAGQYLGLGR